MIHTPDSVKKQWHMILSTGYVNFDPHPIQCAKKQWHMILSTGYVNYDPHPIQCVKTVARDFRHRLRKF